MDNNNDKNNNENIVNSNNENNDNDDENFYDDMPPLISIEEIEEINKKNYINNINNINKKIIYNRSISEPNLISLSYNSEDKYEEYVLYRHKRFRSESIEVLQDNTNSSTKYENLILQSNINLFDNTDNTDNNLISLSREERITKLTEICQKSIIDKVKCPVIDCVCKLFS